MTAMNVATDRDQDEEAQQVHSGIRSHFATDATFREAVRRGLASIETGECKTLDSVSTEIRVSLTGR